MEKQMSVGQIFEILFEKKGEGRSSRIKHVINTVSALFGVEEDQQALKTLKKEIGRVCSRIFAKFEKSHRIKDRFLQDNALWLQSDAKLLPASSPPTSSSQPGPSSTLRRGRPSQPFGESSDRSKRRKTEDIRKSKSSSELSFATQMSLRHKGKVAEAKLLQEATTTTPTRARKIRRAWLSHQKQIKPYTTDEALALLIDAKLTRAQYCMLRSGAKHRNANIYPSYDKIIEAKRRCYPSNPLVTEKSAEVPLQSLLDHTIQRLLQTNSCAEKISNLSDTHLQNLIAVYKWGCDGSSGHSQYKQKSEEDFSDENIFVTSIVPVQLYAILDEQKVNIWENERPSSTRYCRPIRFRFLKETSDVTREEKDHIDRQIASLVPTRYCLEQREFTIKHILTMTMINGKVASAITETSPQTCYICGAKPSQMNKIDDLLLLDINEESLQYGMSTLHAWIRMFECLLHISYRLGIKKWQIRTNERPLVEERKKQIQQEFKQRLGLLVDMPKQGSGTTNDGNTARTFFKNISISAEITGISENIIKRFFVILRTISSMEKINVEAFRAYCLETAKLYVSEYGWYYMPASVHKILIHGHLIISSAVLPIGRLSEEAQESRNKDLRKYREHFTRKSSREKCNEDLINRLLVSSDPFVSSLYGRKSKKTTNFPPEVLNLLELGQPAEDEGNLDTDEEEVEGRTSDEEYYSE